MYTELSLFPELGPARSNATKGSLSVAGASLVAEFAMATESGAAVVTSMAVASSQPLIAAVSFAGRPHSTRLSGKALMKGTTLNGLHAVPPRKSLVLSS